MEEATDATRRTRLASERTELAWWRTGRAYGSGGGIALGLLTVALIIAD